MQVIDYIKEHGLEALTNDLGIKVKDYPDHNLVVLNYCQIESPKTHPVVMECRGLILEKDTWRVLCRPFDRFFNAGEAPETVEDFDISRAVGMQKVDGSLIKIWHNPMTNWWEIGTRGTAFAESEVNGFDLTFRDLVHRALGVSSHEEFDALVVPNLCTATTYLFELTSQENRVVTRYDGTDLWYLGARDNMSGIDLTRDLHWQQDALRIGAKEVMKFKFDTLEHALEASKQLTDLQEGYVLFDEVTHKRIKVKSPAYVAVHHLRGEGLNPKRIKQLVLTNEYDEYLKYFPEDSDLVAPYVGMLQLLESVMVSTYYLHADKESQKDFALAVKDYPFSAVMFQARAKGKDPLEIWHNADSNMKFKIFTNFLEGSDL